MPTYSRQERQALADLLLTLGPDAPTLCEGWVTRDLVSHLSTREGGGGEAVAADGAFGDADTYEAVIARWRAGPHGLSFYRLPGVEKRFNLIEHVIHHEDVRRAQPGWEPRDVSPGEQDALWRSLGVVGRLMLRKADVGIDLRRPDSQTIGLKGEPRVTVTGDPLELMLFASGRREHARVEIDGSPDAVAKLQGADLSI